MYTYTFKRIVTLSKLIQKNWAENFGIFMAKLSSQLKGIMYRAPKRLKVGLRIHFHIKPI